MTFLDTLKNTASKVAEKAQLLDDAYNMKCYALEGAICSYLPGDNVFLDEYTDDGVDAAEAAVLRGASTVKDKALQVKGRVRVAEVREWMAARKSMLRK